MDIRVIPSLQDLAFEASFKDILGTLSQCYHEGITRLSGFIASQATDLCSLVRDRLDEHLVGQISKQIREKYIRRFNDYILSNSQTKNHIAVWMFLDAVLDNSFTELETHNTDWPFPCQKLIPTIVKWCPQLIKLTIHHSKHPVSGDIRKAHRLQLQEFKLSFLSLRSLLYLTQLSLLNMRVHINRIVLPSLGKACPSLSRLSISTNGNDFLNSDILPLILGEYAYHLRSYNQENSSSSWHGEKALKHLVVPLNYLTPLCLTLRELCFLGKYNNRHITISGAAFALRHLPLLQIVNENFPASHAVQYLESNITEERKSRKMFQKACQEAFKRFGSRLTAPSSAQNLNSTFSSNKLLLTKLDRVNVRNESALRAIGEMCPMLTEINFKEKNDARIRIDSTTLKSILSSWPKLRTIGFCYASLETMTPILEVFAPEVKHLKFLKCKEIKLDDLALCQKLESLRILTRITDSTGQEDVDTTLIPLKIETAFDATTFLPQLTSLHSDCCLGSHSLLLEQKPTLRRIVLHCSHIQTRVEPLRKRLKHSSAYTIDAILESEMERILPFWSQLEVLSISQYTQLSMPAWSSLFPHLGNLKLVKLPGRIHLFESALLSSMRDHFLGRNPPANISLSEVDSQANCKMVQRA